MLVLVGSSHPLRDKARVEPQELADETILVTERGCSYRELFERALADAGVTAHRKIEFGSLEAIKQCLVAGLGLAILPQMAVAREVGQGALAALPWQGPPFPIVTQLCWHKDKWQSPALRAFLEMTPAELKAPCQQAT